MPSLRVGNVTLEGATKADESGGMNAPSKRTEQGFSYTTKVRADPRSASFEAWAEVREIGQITSLRSADRPVSVAFDFVVMGKCKIDDVKVSHESKYPNHAKIRLRVTEVVTPSTGTATVRVSSSDGSSGSSTKSSSPELSEPTLARPESQNTSGGPDGKAIDDVNDWLGY